MTTIEAGIYRHEKSGKLYEVLGTALHTENEQSLVVYKPLYDSEHAFFARPTEMFLETVVYNGIKTARFVRVE